MLNDWVENWIKKTNIPKTVTPRLRFILLAQSYLSGRGFDFSLKTVNKILPATMNYLDMRYLAQFLNNWINKNPKVSPSPDGKPAPMPEHLVNEKSKSLVFLAMVGLGAYFLR